MYWDTKLTGFGVRAYKHVKKYYIHARAKDGKFVKHTIGRVDRMDFAAAYTEAERILKDAAQGITVADRKREVQQRAVERKAETLTLRETLVTYCANRKQLKQSSKDHYKDKLECYLADWMDQPLLSITPGVVLETHAEIGKKSKAQADHVFRVVRAVFNQMMMLHSEVFTRNPVQLLSSMGAWYKVPRRKTHIAESQLPLFFGCLQRYPGVVADYLEALLYTGIRSASEIAQLTVSQVDFVDRMLTLHDTKTKELFQVPINEAAALVLQRRVDDTKAQGCQFLFYAFQEQAARNGEYRPKVPHKPLKDVRGTIKAIFMGTELVGLTPHDLRRTFLNFAEELEISQLTQKSLVGHAVPTDVTDGYKVIPVRRQKRALARVEAYIKRHARQVTAAAEE